MLYFIFTFPGEVKAPKVLLHLRSQAMTRKHKLLYWSQAGVEGVPRLSGFLGFSGRNEARSNVSDFFGSSSVKFLVLKYVCS